MIALSTSLNVNKKENENGGSGFASMYAGAALGTATSIQAISASVKEAGTATNIYNDFATNMTYVHWLDAIGAVLIIAGLIVFLPAIAAFFSRKNRTTWKQIRTLIGSIVLLVGFILIGIAAYNSSTLSKVSITFSKSEMLASIWDSYKENFVQSSTSRTVDPSQDSITTSEGQSYTMLRSVWLDDQTTFNASWSWTQANLGRPNDNLFSWLYGQNASGTYGILTSEGGENTASDADTDIALSLVFAYGRWQEPQYLTSARAIISDIWNEEVVMIDGKPYLAADNLEKTSKLPTIAVDVSYFSPYAYRIFAQVDPSHPWSALVDNSYDVIQESMTADLNESSTADLPPDWISVNKKTGAITPLVSSSSDSNYGYDAMRLPWRLALDWEWNKDPRDQQILEQMSFLQDQWDDNGKLLAVYDHNGTPDATYEDPAVYGGDLGYFVVADPKDAQSIYNDKLLILYDPDSDDWKVPLGYYDSNWVWFGMALYNNELPNLAKNVTASSSITNP